MFTSFFLRANPLQLCVLMVLPYGIYKLTDLGGSPGGRIGLIAYFMLIYFGWLYSVGVSANRRLDPALQMPLLLLRIAVIVPFLYLPVFVFLYLVPLYQGTIQQPPQGLVVIHFAALLSAVYCIWYCARQFTTLRLGSETSFIDYYPAFMGFWFGFVGVWFLQPKIRELLATDDGNPAQS